MEFLNSVAADVGLGGLGIVGTLLLGVALLFVLVKFLSLPIKLVWNGLLGAVLLWLFNLVGGLFGLSVKITFIKALIAGFFGVVGAAAVIFYEIFG